MQVNSTMSHVKKPGRAKASHRNDSGSVVAFARNNDDRKNTGYARASQDSIEMTDSMSKWKTMEAHV
ncbi:hypothetical protein EDS67_05715 [candidate division KSB1 bacterium]|nr:MAG: hypothetical protein EDS67_05715 [candidate division KSB1 bacterium]MBC6946727.1 hypothetical protein [candidate division KSB1 bacterium]MCE7940362.1 hypothetical protein [Chlorobi bacterium CHB1]